MLEQPRILDAIIDRFPEARILVIGDLMLDRFIWGKVRRISPEAPVPVVQVTRETAHLGGAANVVSNIQALGGRALPIGLIGNDETGKAIIELLKRGGIGSDGLVMADAFQTIEKTRIIAHHQQVVRFDRENESLDVGIFLAAVIEKIDALIAGKRAVIVSDYGKGLITPRVLTHLRGFKDRVLLNVDPKDENFDHYLNCHIITPNQAEAERMSGTAISDEPSLRFAAARIFARLDCNHLLITRGELGMALFQGPDDLSLIPTLAREVFDVSGAGDTVIATYSLAKSVGASAQQAAVLANAAAGVVVGKLGTATVAAGELKAALRRAP